MKLLGTIMHRKLFRNFVWFRKRVNPLILVVNEKKSDILTEIGSEKAQVIADFFAHFDDDGARWIFPPRHRRGKLSVSDLRVLS